MASEDPDSRKISQDASSTSVPIVASSNSLEELSSDVVSNDDIHLEATATSETNSTSQGAQGDVKGWPEPAGYDQTNRAGASQESSGLSTTKYSGEKSGGGMGGLFRKIIASARDAGGSLVRSVEPIDAKKEASVSYGTNPQSLEQDMASFFNKVDTYAKLELQDTLSDFECLEQMNRVSYAKYGELASTLGGLSELQKDLQEKFEEMQPVLEEVDRMHATVIDLERVVEHLEKYSERLVQKASNALQ
mmetsp:Transcript_16023/g.30984  ORF Transcript_16023/g.30984 Transcript_16023/m.30984 type:complete len:248 (-) Transcript_16023:251-994(-)